MGEKTSQSEIGRRWGVNRSRISQYKAEGMPVKTIESAFDWLAVNYPDRAVMVLEKNGKALVAEEYTSPQNNSQNVEAQGTGVSCVVARLSKSEGVAWKMLDHAIKTNDIARVAGLSKNYQSAAEARLSAEKNFIEYQVRKNELLPYSEAIEMIGKILAPIKSQLTALEYSAAPRANPSDPELAREAIGSEVDKMCEHITKALEELKK